MMDFTNIDTENWCQHLGTVAKDLQSRDCGNHHYMVFNKQTQKVSLAKKNEMTRDLHKFSLEEIELISKSFFEAEWKDSYQVLLKERIKKWNRCSNQLKRVLATVIYALATVALFGIPFFYFRSFLRSNYSMHCHLQKLKKQIEEEEAKEKQLRIKFNLNDEWPKRTVFAIGAFQKDFEDQQTTKCLVDKAGLEKDLNGYVKEMSEPKAKSASYLLDPNLYEILPQFQSDFSRDQQVLLEDAFLEIKEKKLLVDLDNVKDFTKEEIFEFFHFLKAELYLAIAEKGKEKSELIDLLKSDRKFNDAFAKLFQRERTFQAAEKIEKLIVSPEDQRWRIILQGAAAQMSTVSWNLYATFINASHQELVTQFFGEGENSYRLLFERLKEETPPVKLEVLRDPVNHSIQSVQVSVEGFIGLSKIFKAKKTPELFLPNRVTQVTLKYTIQLNEQNQAVVSNIVTTYIPMDLSTVPPAV